MFGHALDYFRACNPIKTSRRNRFLKFFSKSSSFEDQRVPAHWLTPVIKPICGTFLTYFTVAEMGMTNHLR